MFSSGDGRVRVTIVISEITVRPGRIEALIDVARHARKTISNPGFGDRILGLVPGLGDQACVSDSRSFADELADTHLAHVVEHVALAVVGAVAPVLYPDARERVYVGKTEWRDLLWGEGRYRLTLQCPDDVVGVGALTIACSFVEWAWRPSGDAPSFDTQCERLVSAGASLRGRRGR